MDGIKTAILKNVLKRELVGKALLSVEVFRDDYMERQTAFPDIVERTECLNRNLSNSVTLIKDVCIRGKYIFIRTVGRCVYNYIILSPYKGSFSKQKGEDSCYCFRLNDAFLYFNDPFSTSRFHVASDKEANVFLNRLSIHVTDLSIKDLNILLSILSRRKQAVKGISDMFTSERHVSGIDDVLCSEILYDAKIHPRKLVTSFSSDDAVKLYSGISNTVSRMMEELSVDPEEYFSGKSVEPELRIYGKKEVEGFPVMLDRHRGEEIYYCSDVQK